MIWKNVLKYRLAVTGFLFVVFAIAIALGIMRQQNIAVETRPQSALVPTLQYLTMADLNELKTVALAQAAAIADLRVAQKSLAIELSARIDPLEAALKSMQITTGSISKGKR